MIHTFGPWSAPAGPDRADGLLSLTAFAGLDGSVLHHARWRDDASCVRWFGRRPPTRYEERSSYHGASRPPARMLAVPAFECVDASAQTQLCQAIVANLNDLAPPGLITAHLYASLDGTRVVNHARWTGEQAWRGFVTGAANARMRDTFAALSGVRPLNEALAATRYRILR